jgi:hypothetical protein
VSFSFVIWDLFRRLPDHALRPGYRLSAIREAQHPEQNPIGHGEQNNRDSREPP